MVFPVSLLILEFREGRLAFQSIQFLFFVRTKRLVSSKILAGVPGGDVMFKSNEHRKIHENDS